MPPMPDLCLLRLFDYLDLATLSSVGLVCRQFSALQKVSLKRRRSLRLLIGDKAHSLIKTSYLTIPYSTELPPESDSGASQLHVRKLSPALVDFLSRSLPHVQVLIVAVDDNLDHGGLQSLVALLSQIASLESLHLYYSHFDDRLMNPRMQYQTSAHLFRLLNSINSLPNPQLVSLDIRNTLLQHCASLPQSIRFPVLTRLQHFYFFSYDCLTNIMQLFSEAPALPQLRALGFGNEFLDQNARLSSLLELSPELLSKVTFLPNLHFPLNSDILRAFGHYSNPFRSLHRLSFSLGQLSLAQLSDYLAPLPQLYYLHLSVETRLPRCEDSLTALPTIKILSIEAITTSPADLASQQWPLLFPCVEILRLYPQYMHCGSCCDGSNGVITFIEHRFDGSCRRGLVRSWRDLPMLRRVYNSITKENILF